MPELPEVEATRRAIEPELLGARIVDAEARRARMVRRQERPADFGDRLVGRRIDIVDRHGKFLMVGVEGDLTWVTHLGMSGRVAMEDATAPEAPHTNVLVTFASGRQFRLVDPRTFGFVAVYTPDELAESSLAQLGPDAVKELPRSRRLHALLQQRRAPIKAVLLDQRFLAGLGNIYADEALHRAGIAPQRPADEVGIDATVALRKGIVATLAAGLRHGGTSLDDLAYLLPDGRAGEFVSRLRVYGREGEPCRVCGTPVRRRMLRQRSTHWCPTCQT